MRKLSIITIAVFILSTTANGQITKGSILLGGSLKFDKNERDETPSYEYIEKNFSLTPSIGYTYKENKVLGINLNFSRGKVTYSDVSEDLKGYGGGIFYRQYFPFTQRFFFYGNASLDYNHIKIDHNRPNYNRTITDKLSSLFINPGITFAASKRFHLELALPELLRIQYRSIVTKTTTAINQDINKNKYMKISTNLSEFGSIGLGFRIVLGK